MACYHPLIGVSIGVNTDTGKTNYKILPYDEKYFTDSKYGKDKVVVIPCGRCIGCRLEYSRQWANRLMLELESHDAAWFVTLTYNEDHVPRGYYADPETGEALESLTLSKRDVQLFMKRLRKAFPDDRIRYFCSGEYGTETFRPHYHLIIFGLHLTDLVPLSKSVLGYQYYRSAALERCWSVLSKDSMTPLAEPIGHVVVGEVTWDTCAYTARYVTKKLTGSMAYVYSDFDLVPPFSLMSRKPGIGREYYESHPDLFKREYINISTEKGGRKFRPPKYYERLFEIDNPDEAKQRKEVRKAMAEASKVAKLERTDLSYLELLQVEEDVLESRTKVLKRGL